MPGTAAPRVEMTCLQGLADLERLEGPWLECMGAGEPENAATVMRLMLAHMVVLNKRVMSAMVLDRLDAELADVSSADFKAGYQRGCQQASEH